VHVASFCRRVARAGLVALTLAAAGTAAQTPRGVNARDLESPSKGRAVEITVNPAIKSEKTSEWILLPIPKASPTGVLSVVALNPQKNLLLNPGAACCTDARYLSDANVMSSVSPWAQDCPATMSEIMEPAETAVSRDFSATAC